MKVFKEFREFIARGNVIELAVAVVMGGAFNAIVNSAVNDLMMPLFSFFTAGTDFSTLKIVIGTGDDAASLNYGNFIAAVVHFLVVSIVLFLTVKTYNRFKDKKTDEKPPARKCQFCGSNIAETAVRCPFCTSILDEEAVPVRNR